MKHSMLGLALLMSASLIDAGDQKTHSDNSDIDKNIFTINGRIASPYKTQFVDSLSDAFFVIESDPIKPLYTNAHERTMIKSTMTCEDFENTDWGPHMNKVMNDRQSIDKLQAFIFHVTASLVDIREPNIVLKVIDNTLAMMPESGLFMLIQYTYGIKRDGEKAEILLNPDGTKTIPVKPLLMKLLNKYRSHEQPNTPVEAIKKEGGLFFGQ
jgi:hypothetical protein